MERLHKMVNGNRVDLTEEEEIALRAEWEKNQIAYSEKRLQKEIEEQAKDMAKKRLCEKLGIEMEELKLIEGN